jgi:hypothetical protein
MAHIHTSPRRGEVAAKLAYSFAAGEGKSPKANL